MKIGSMTYYFYILRCADNSLYCGITPDLKKRLNDHNSGNGRGAKYTRAKLPVKLVYSEELPDRSTALKREFEVKSWTKN